MRVLILAVAFVTGGACDPVAPALPPPGPNAIDIVIKTEPPGATVLVDGAAVGTSPATIKLNPGPHRLRASMSGYYPAPELKVQVGAAEAREHTLTLVASH